MGKSVLADGKERVVTHGEWLKTLRALVGMTQETLWLKSAVPRATIALLETDATALSRTHAVRLAGALGCSLQALVCAAPTPDETHLLLALHELGIQPNSLCPKVSIKHRQNVDSSWFIAALEKYRSESAMDEFQSKLKMNISTLIKVIRVRGLHYPLRGRVRKLLGVGETDVFRVVLVHIFKLDQGFLDGPKLDIEPLYAAKPAQSVTEASTELGEEGRALAKLLNHESSTYGMGNDSMERVGVSIPKGAKVYIAPFSGDLFSIHSKAVAVKIKTASGDGFCIRQLMVDAGRQYLRAWNSAYPTLEVNADTQVVGLVKKWSMSF